MGFFQKLFRRSKSTTNGSSATETSAINIGNDNNNKKDAGRKHKGKRPNRKQQAQLNAKQGRGFRRDDSPTEQIGPVGLPEGLQIVNITPNNLAMDQGGSNTPVLSPSLALLRRGPDLSDGTQRPMISPRNPTTINTANRSPTTPVDLDDSPPTSIALSNHPHDELLLLPQQQHQLNLGINTKTGLDENQMLKQLSQQYTAQQMQQPPQQQHQAVFSMPESVPSPPKLRFSAGNVSVNTGDDSSNDDGSSFNLSTDAEDTEYEMMRRRLGAAAARHHLSQNLNIDSNRSIATNYTTDGETSVFPGLPSEDEMTTTTQSVTKEASQQSILHLPQPPTVNPVTGASLIPYDSYTSSMPLKFSPTSQRDDDDDYDDEALLPDKNHRSPPQSPPTVTKKSLLSTLGLRKSDSPERVSSRRVVSPVHKVGGKEQLLMPSHNNNNAHFMDAAAWDKFQGP